MVHWSSAILKIIYLNQVVVFCGEGWAKQESILALYVSLPAFHFSLCYSNGLWLKDFEKNILLQLPEKGFGTSFPITLLEKLETYVYAHKNPNTIFYKKICNAFIYLFVCFSIADRMYTSTFAFLYLHKENKTEYPKFTYEVVVNSTNIFFFRVSTALTHFLSSAALISANRSSTQLVHYDKLTLVTENWLILATKQTVTSYVSR